MNQDDKLIDAGHFSFLEMIKVVSHITGPNNAKGTLLRTGMSAADECDTVSFDTMEDFIASIDELDNPISQFEGKAVHYGDGVFGLPTCPFARSIKSYTQVTGTLPSEFGEVTDKLNTPSGMTERLRIGAGAAVSPFCGVHQSVRSALGAKRVKIGGRFLKVTQLGCKSGAGKKGVSHHLCQGAGVDTERVADVLDDNMCCYRLELQQA